MNPTRRQFLRVALTGAAALPLAGKALASTALRPEFALSDEHLLEQLERTAFDFFWNESHPATGLIMDKADADGHGSPGIASIAATGFGLTALAIGHKRSYRSQAEIENRVAQTLRSSLPVRSWSMASFITLWSPQTVSACAGPKSPRSIMQFSYVASSPAASILTRAPFRMMPPRFSNGWNGPGR